VHWFVGRRKCTGRNGLQQSRRFRFIGTGADGTSYDAGCTNGSGSGSETERIDVDAVEIDMEIVKQMLGGIFLAAGLIPNLLSLPMLLSRLTVRMLGKTDRMHCP
jgi:hypothetical protein